MRKSKFYAIWVVVSYFCLFNTFVAYAGSTCAGYASFLGKSYCYQESYVYTPKYSRVKVLNFTSDLSSAEKLSVDLSYRTAYPKATFLSSSTIKYNCHSYAWYNSSPYNQYWMDTPSAYMNDGSYLGMCAENPSNGWKVYYPNGNHSAVSVGNKTVRSKWGMAPLFQHAINYGPSSYNMSCYYSFRR